MHLKTSNSAGACQWLLYVSIVFMLSSCAASKGYAPDTKIPPQVMLKDFRFFRNVLEESHPSLYWFQSKDSIDYFFNLAESQLKDSLTERQFRSRLNFVLAKIRCGHTASRYSKRYSTFLDTANLPLFPLQVKCWKDTIVATSVMTRTPNPLSRGSIVKAINGIPAAKLIDTFFNYINGDGYSDQGRYQFLSNRGNFGTLYKTIFGLTPYFRVEYVDSIGATEFTTLPVFEPSEDTSGHVRRPVGRDRTDEQHTLEIDTSLRSGYMTLNTFSRGNGIPRFFKRSFKTLRKHKIQYLVLDVRSNGGGDAGNSTMLTRYIANQRFKIADSLYAIRRSSKYSSYIKWQPIYWLMMTLVTHKGKDNRYHFGYFERHYFSPKKRNHFDGEVFIITGGNSFSATTLFAQKLKGQSNVHIVGEETGGGSYGNTAWMLPEVTLPKTRVRFRLPKFRLVMEKELVREGRGVLPDILASPSVADIRKGRDIKAETVRQIILNKRALASKSPAR